MGIYDEDIEMVVEQSTPTPKKKPKRSSVKKKPPKEKKTASPKKKRKAKKNVDGITPLTQPKQENPKLTVEQFFASIKPSPAYEKHLVKCHCFLPQYKNLDDPPAHQFVVFSILNEQGDVIPSYAQCNNCGIIHRVIEVGESQITRKESMLSLPQIDDIKPSLPDWLVTILEKHDCELHVWQEAEFIYRNKLFGKHIILSREREGNIVIGKLLIILGERLHKIETFEQDESPI